MTASRPVAAWSASAETTVVRSLTMPRTTNQVTSEAKMPRPAPRKIGMV